jgi:hypothetical protein
VKFTEGDNVSTVAQLHGAPYMFVCHTNTKLLCPRCYWLQLDGVKRYGSVVKKSWRESQRLSAYAAPVPSSPYIITIRYKELISDSL